MTGMFVCPCVACTRMQATNAPTLTAQQAGEIKATQVFPFGPFGYPVGYPVGYPFGVPFGYPYGPVPFLFGTLGGLFGPWRRRRRFGFLQASPDLDAMIDGFDKETGVLAQSEMAGIPHVVAHDSLREIMGYAMSRIDPGRPVTDVPGTADRIANDFMAEIGDLFAPGNLPQQNLAEIREGLKPIIAFVLIHHKTTK